MNSVVAEQRKEARTQLSWPVSMWIPDARRFFNGRSSNISKTGVFLTMPVTAPIKTGYTVELNFPRTEQLAKEKGSFARIKSGRVVRIDRENLFKGANLGIAVQFDS